MSTSTIHISTDLSGVKTEIDNAEQQISKFQIRAITRLRRTMELGFLVAEVGGQVVDETMRIYASAVARGIEVLYTVGAAFAAGVPFFSFTTARIGGQIAAIISMTVLLRKLQAGKVDQARQWRSASMLFRMGSW